MVSDLWQKDFLEYVYWKEIVLLSSTASEFSNIFIHINFVVHKSGTKYIQINVSLKYWEQRSTFSTPLG